MLSTIKSRYIIEYYSFFEIEGVMQGITMKKCAMVRLVVPFLSLERTADSYLRHVDSWRSDQDVWSARPEAVRAPRLPERRRPPGLSNASTASPALLTALEQALHDAGVAHNDIKPDNILIDGEVVKLCDFGLASNGKLMCVHPRPSFSLLQLTLCFSVFGGTPQFMSPEVFARRAARQWLASAPLSSRNVPRDECKELVDLLQLGEGTSSFSGDVYSLAVSWCVFSIGSRGIRTRELTILARLCAALGVHRPFPSLDYTPSKDNSATQHADHAYHFFGRVILPQSFENGELMRSSLAESSITLENSSATSLASSRTALSSLRTERPSLRSFKESTRPSSLVCSRSS